MPHHPGPLSYHRSPSIRAASRSMLILALLGIFAAILLLLSLERWSIRHSSTEMQARLRLRRLGIALNHWVADQSFERFPAIVNPPPGSPWDPDRLGSARSFLAPYLHGNTPLRQGEDESDVDFYQRRLRQELTVDPHTGLEFWYNSALSQMRPDQLIGDPAQSWYFRSQRNLEGEWPSRKGGEVGAWTVQGTTIQRQISSADIQRLRARLNELERSHAGRAEKDWTHDLHFLRREVARLEALFQDFAEEVEGQDERVLSQMALDAEVRFLTAAELLDTP